MALMMTKSTACETSLSVLEEGTQKFIESSTATDADDSATFASDLDEEETESNKGVIDSEDKEELSSRGRCCCF